MLGPVPPFLRYKYVVIIPKTRLIRISTKLTNIKYRLLQSYILLAQTIYATGKSL